MTFNRLLRACCVLSTILGFRTVVLNWEQMAVSEGIFGVCVCVVVGRVDAIPTQWVEARNAAKLPTQNRKASHNKILPGSKCQSC